MIVKKFGYLILFLKASHLTSLLEVRPSVRAIYQRRRRYCHLPNSDENIQRCPRTHTNKHPKPAKASRETAPPRQWTGVYFLSKLWSGVFLAQTSSVISAEADSKLDNEFAHCKRTFAAGNGNEQNAHRRSTSRHQWAGDEDNQGETDPAHCISARNTTFLLCATHGTNSRRV